MHRAVGKHEKAVYLVLQAVQDARGELSLEFWSPI